MEKLLLTNSIVLIILGLAWSNRNLPNLMIKALIVVLGTLNLFQWSVIVNLFN